jgi:hypothetical protein
VGAHNAVRALYVAYEGRQWTANVALCRLGYEAKRHTQFLLSAGCDAVSSPGIRVKEDPCLIQSPTGSRNASLSSG